MPWVFFIALGIAAEILFAFTKRLQRKARPEGECHNNYKFSYSNAIINYLAGDFCFMN